MKQRFNSVDTAENYYDIIIPEHKERVKHAFLSLRNGQTNALDVEHQVIDNHNQKLWIETIGIISGYEAGGSAKQIVGASYNIEDKKTLQEALISAKEKAEESNRLKSSFLANISHEIRTPLNAIIGFSSILSEKCDDKEGKFYSQVIEHNNQLLLRLINDILDLSKIEAGDIQFTFSNVDINNYLKEIEAFAKMKANDKVEVVLEMPLEKCIFYPFFPFLD